MKKNLNIYVTCILVLFFLHSTVALTAESKEDYKSGDREDVLSQPKNSTDKGSTSTKKDRPGEVSSDSGSGPLGTTGSSSGTNPSGTAPAAGSSDSGVGPAYQGKRKSAE